MDLHENGEKYTSTDCTEYPDDKGIQVKEEQLDILEQLMDQNGIYNDEASSVKDEQDEFSGYRQRNEKNQLICTLKTEVKVNNAYISEPPPLVSIERSTKYPDNKGIRVKEEQLDIPEQLMDQNDIYNDEASPVKDEQDEFSRYQQRNEKNQLICTLKTEVKVNNAYISEPPPLVLIERNSHKNSSSSTQMLPESVNTTKKKFECKYCDFETKRKKQLGSHWKAVHFNARPYKCEVCTYSTNRRTYLRRHVDNVHMNLKEHKCHLCEYKSNDPRSLKLHIDYVHLNLNKKKCHMCDYSTSQQANLTRHIQCVHLNSKPHKCHVCDFATNLNNNLKKHLSVMHSIE